MNLSNVIKKSFLSLIAMCLLSVGLGFNSVKASDNSIQYDMTTISESFEELDPYIAVLDNRFVLSLPSNVLLSTDLREKVENQLNIVNKTISDSNYIIDINTKVARPQDEISTRIYGKNAIYIHWNYFEIWMDGGLVNSLTKAGAAGAIALIVSFFPPLVAWIAANPLAGVALAAVVVSLVDSLIGYTVDDGVIVHYNFLQFRVTHIEFQ